MSRGIGAQTRRRLMGEVLRLIDQNPECRLSKIEALAGIQIGLSPKKVREYIRQFVASGQIEETTKGFKFVKP